MTSYYRSLIRLYGSHARHPFAMLFILAPTSNEAESTFWTAWGIDLCIVLVFCSSCLAIIIVDTHSYVT